MLGTVGRRLNKVSLKPERSLNKLSCININRRCLTRVTHNSRTLTNPCPSSSRSNWNLKILIFEEGGIPENPEKDPRSQDKNQQQTQPTYDAGSMNRTWDAWVGGEHSHHCATPALHIIDLSKLTAKINSANE